MAVRTLVFPMLACRANRRTVSGIIGVSPIAVLVFAGLLSPMFLSAAAEPPAKPRHDTEAELAG